MTLIIPATILSGIIALFLMRTSRIRAEVDPVTNCFVLKYDAIHTVLGLVIGFELPVLIVFFLLPILDLIGMLILVPFTLVSIIQGVRMVGESHYYRLEFGGDSLRQSGFLQKPIVIYWTEIADVKYENRTLYIRGQNRKKITVSQWAIGFPTLLATIAEKVPSKAAAISTS